MAEITDDYFAECDFIAIRRRCAECIGFDIIFIYICRKPTRLFEGLLIIAKNTLATYETHRRTNRHPYTPSNSNRITVSCIIGIFFITEGALNR